MYKIYPLLLGKQYRTKGFMTYNIDLDEKLWLSVIAWLVRDEDNAFLVDTGAPLALMNDVRRDLPNEEIATLEELLKKHGLEPKDIKKLIITHLHYDHCGYLPLFKHADVYVQKSELDFAYNPHPIQKVMYRTNLFEDINFTAYDGDREILPGVTALYTPGHSGGNQSVQIETAKGKAIISGLCCLMENFKPTGRHKDMEVLVTGHHLDVRENYDSLCRIKKQADILIPQHEMSIAELECIPDSL
ncbi:MBL fold metallo-hydrolase [Synergistales bacterium]|nr:MBL fold metallo-hydrolase [Synergistales bacterium]